MPPLLFSFYVGKINLQNGVFMPTPLIITLSVIGGLLLLFIIAYFILVTPRRKREEMNKFKKRRYAHRGLHGEGVAENSMSAFRAATDGGWGIELDVRLTKDGELVVFHDPTLIRVAGVEGKVMDRTLAELRELRLSGTEDTIPTFREVLELVDGRVPLLVELKEEAGEYGVTEKTLEILADYRGDFMIESFNPLALARVKKKAPQIVRGFLSQNFAKTEEYRGFTYFLLKNLMLNVICRPDFIAYCHSDYKCSSFRFVKGFFRTPCFAWTTESAEDDEAAIRHGFSGTIFQHYKPDTFVK